MAKLNLEDVWPIMKKYDFYKDNEIASEYLCTICKKILINAHISSCTCRYCFDCISSYLNNEKKVCPGNNEDCKMELISLNENLVVDYAMNNKISRLTVKCPEKSCEFQNDLRTIEGHIRICNYRSVCCPYLNIGCNSSNMHAGNVGDHLQLEIGNHSKLLIDCIDNQNNEIGRLKIFVDKLGEENKMLKYEINEIKLDGEKKQMKCDEQDREIDLLNKDMVVLRNVDKYMRDDFDELKLNGVRDKVVNIIIIIIIINIINQFNDKYHQIENKFVMTTMSNKIDETIKNVENKLLKMEINQNKMRNEEFVWRIDKINDKIKDAKNGINTTIYSDSFYLHKYGYKMCLRMDPDGDSVGKGTHLSVYFCMMKGEFDDILQWPFKYDVTLSLINQQIGLVHVSRTTKYDDLPNSKNWNKTMNERNTGIGFHKFIELKELSTNANLACNNQIFIKCSVNLSS